MSYIWKWSAFFSSSASMNTRSVLFLVVAAISWEFHAFNHDILNIVQHIEIHFGVGTKKKNAFFSVHFPLHIFKQLMKMIALLTNSVVLLGLDREKKILNISIGLIDSCGRCEQLKKGKNGLVWDRQRWRKGKKEPFPLWLSMLYPAHWPYIVNQNRNGFPFLVWSK